MRLLIFVDTHGNMNHMFRLIEQSRNADILVCAGDFTIFEADISDILKRFNSIGKPLMIIPGNHEIAHTIITASAGLPNIHVIHKSFFIKDDFVFFGYGGGGFNTEDPKFDMAAKSFIKELTELEKKNSMIYKIVFVSHAPPYATRLDDLGEHVGIKNFTKFIIEEKPVLVVCGHLHENAGLEDYINDTRIINPGPIGKIIELK